jgi:hypothetical protein
MTLLKNIGASMGYFEFKLIPDEFWLKPAPHPSVS